MLSVHELSHIMVGKIFGYDIDKVVIYPFGICAQMEYIGFGNVFKELLIILAGPCAHFVFPFMFHWFVKLTFISPGFCEYLEMLNLSILIFNILPIYPLDGGRVIQCFTHMILSFRKAQIMTLIISIINLMLLYYYQFLNGVNGIIILIFLGFQIFIGFKQLTLSQLSFYHYRYLHPIKGIDKMNDGDDLYRSRHNVMRRGLGWMNEHEWLSLYFHHHKVEGKKNDYVI